MEGFTENLFENITCLMDNTTSSSSEYLTDMTQLKMSKVNMDENVTDNTRIEISGSRTTSRCWQNYSSNDRKHPHPNNDTHQYHTTKWKVGSTVLKNTSLCPFKSDGCCLF